MWYAMLAIEYEQTASADNTALKKKTKITSNIPCTR